MPILQYETRVSPDGYITLPPIPEYRDRKVFVCVDEGRDDIDGDIPIRPRIVERTPEERQYAIRKFLETFGGCMEGMPHMTAKEVRCERLEKKYGSEK